MHLRSGGLLFLFIPASFRLDVCIVSSQKQESFDPLNAIAIMTRLSFGTTFPF